MKDHELISAVDEFVTEFTKLMDVDAIVSCNLSEVEDTKQKLVTIEYDGENLGYMIGNHGLHLKGLQHVLSLMINKKFIKEGEENIYVTVDVSGYKKIRNEKVEKMALKMADEARMKGKAVNMPPMCPSERRIVHVALSNLSDIKTESFGEGLERYVRIIPNSEVDLNLLEDEIVDELNNSKEEKPAE